MSKRDEQYGADALAAGVDRYHAGQHPQQRQDRSAESMPQPGSLAEAIEAATPKPVRAARREDTAVDAASLTDADGNRKPTTQYLEAALEGEFRKDGI